MTEIQVGDTVETTFRGVVEVVGSATFCVKREGTGGSSYVRKDETKFVSRPKSPMPTKVGTVLVEDDSYTWVRANAGWFSSWFYNAATEPWSDEQLQPYWESGSLKEAKFS